MDHEKLMEVKNKLIFTKHGIDNLTSRRPNITVDEVAKSVAFGIKGFAGHRRYKTTYNGIETIWKNDESGFYVVITYYRVPQKRFKKVRQFS